MHHQATVREERDPRCFGRVVKGRYVVFSFSLLFRSTSRLTLEGDVPTVRLICSYNSEYDQTRKLIREERLIHGQGMPGKLSHFKFHIKQPKTYVEAGFITFF